MEVTSITKRHKSSSSKVKSEENACVFLRQQGNYSPRVCPSGTNCHCKFLFECSGTPMEEDSSCPAQVLSTRQLISSSRQCTGSPGSCCTRIFSPKTSVHAQSSAILPWFIPLWLFSVPRKWSYHWKGTSLKMFKTSKELWHRVFGPYHKKTCRSFQSLLDHATYCTDAEGMYFE